MESILEFAASKKSLDLLLKAESAILCINALSLLLFGWGVIGMLVVPVLLFFLIYRLLVLSGFKDGNTLATWWYSVISCFFVLRFVPFLAIQLGADTGSRFAVAKEMASPLALLLIFAVMCVRVMGSARAVLELQGAPRFTAITAMALSGLGLYAGFGWVMLGTTIETAFYGFRLRLH